MIQDIFVAALGGARAAGAAIDAELKKMKESGALPAAEIEEIAREAKKALEARTREARENAGPVLDAARDGLRKLLGVPSTQQLASLAERLERAVAALEKAQAQARPGEHPGPG